MIQCKHDRTQLMKLVCSNGAIQVREICLACGGNARGAGINVPHSEVANIGELPSLDRLRSEDQQRSLFE